MRSLLILIAMGAVTGMACQSKNSATTEMATTPSTAVADASKAQPVPSVKPAAVATPEPKPASPAVAQAASLRDLAAKYLESDGHGGWRKNEQAATELEKLGPEHMQQLWALLKAPQVEVRRSMAVFLLPQLDPTNREQVAAFDALLDDSDRMVRARAIDAVRQFSKGDQIAALSRLTALLDPTREDRPENRIAAIRLIGSLRRDAEHALVELTSAARYDPDSKVRAAALAASVTIATTTPVLQVLRQALTDKEASVRLVSASRLKQLGVTATPVAPQLAATLSDSSSDVGEMAAEALIAIGTPSVEPLAGQLTTGNSAARKLALAALATLGPVAKSAGPAIEKCRQDADPQVRQLAEAALKRIGAQ